MRIREKDGKGEGGNENIYEGKEGGIITFDAQHIRENI